MKNRRFWFIFLLVLIAWALAEVYPPSARDLIQQFAGRARNTDTTFTNILSSAAELQAAATNSEFANLAEAIGTNDITKYFPFFSDATNQSNPTIYILNRVQSDAEGKIKLGLDLQGGTAFLMGMETNDMVQTNSMNSQQDQANAIAQAVEVLRKRVDQFGVAEPVIQPAGANEVLVQLPGLSESAKDEAQTNLSKAAYLEFRLVKQDSADIIANHEPIPPGYEILKMSQAPFNGSPRPPITVVLPKKGQSDLSGDITSDAFPSRDDMGNPDIIFKLKPDAAAAFGKMTTDYTGHEMAVVLDGQLQSVATMETPILDGNVRITGSFSQVEAQNLASVLQNPLREPLKLEYSYDVSPTLGSDSIHSGIRASIAAVIFVSLFMLIYYRLAGLTANIALITNIVILMGVMCDAGVTFTLPGIAGVVLTIGMAVDANVLIYERLREELAKGKSIRGAIAAGYSRAFGTIFDSHVTTLISSVILIFMGTGEIKGFGVTLTIGVAASLFTALVVTRLIFDFLLDRNWIKTLGMFHFIRATKVNFMSVAKPLFIITWIFAIGALIYGGTCEGKKLFGVDFLGGDSTMFSYSQQIGLDQVRSTLAQIGQKDAQIQYQKSVSGGTETLRVTTEENTSTQVQQTLEKAFPQANLKVVMQQHVGADVGRDVLNSAIGASLMAMFGILVYVAFRYEFSFALGAIVAVIHDVLLTLGCYCISYHLSGRQFNATVVAAVLTIIGFSLNDKVVIFDRIREDLKMGMRGTFKEIINAALNQTLSRTIITSGTVFIATGCLYVFGGGVINDFAFTFLVGIITGTYSSIYIASAFVLWWHKGQRPAIGGSGVTMQNSDAAKA
ncbi:MAG TPA: protein translocase subunit SecD [Verrucomicrobiae bacterium]|jgi:SecD/SecF fusion protein